MKQPPNFLVIMTDQQRADHLGCYGNPIVKTPTLDTLAARGIRFDQFYVSNPICQPTRAALATAARRARAVGEAGARRGLVLGGTAGRAVPTARRAARILEGRADAEPARRAASRRRERANAARLARVGAPRALARIKRAW